LDVVPCDLLHLRLESIAQAVTVVGLWRADGPVLLARDLDDKNIVWVGMWLYSSKWVVHVGAEQAGTGSFPGS